MDNKLGQHRIFNRNKIPLRAMRYRIQNRIERIQKIHAGLVLTAMVVV